MILMPHILDVIANENACYKRNELEFAFVAERGNMRGQRGGRSSFRDRQDRQVQIIFSETSHYPEKKSSNSTGIKILPKFSQCETGLSVLKNKPWFNVTLCFLSRY